MGAVPSSVVRRHRARRVIGAAAAVVVTLGVMATAGSAVASTPRLNSAARAVPNVTAPGAPTHVVPTAGDAQVKLTWSGPTDTGGAPVQYYIVRYSTDGGSSWISGPTVYDTVVTIKNLDNGTAYVFEVRANNGTASGAYSDATSPVTPHGTGGGGGGGADATAITAPKSAAVTLGGSATVSTTVTDTTTSSPVASATVTLLAKAADAASFVEIGTAQTTDSSGAAQITLTPQVTTDYRWSYDGDSSHSSAISSVGTVTVGQIVDAHLTAAKVHHGKHAEVYGTIAPNSTGEKVTLQQRHGGKWKTVGHGKVKVQKLPDGRHRNGFVIEVATQAKGKQVLRVKSHDTQDTVAGVSKRLKLTVT